MTEISKKKILFVSSVSDFYKFILNNMKICLDLGMDVSYACNLNTRAGEELKQVCTNLGIHLYHVEFARSPYSKQNIKAYKQLKELIEKENFNILDTHTPMASIISRWICKKRDMKIMYTAHGFHFYKGAPLKNWMLYYPMEKYFSKYTDILITINKEDYHRANDKFKMKQLEYIPGVGIDVEKISQIKGSKDKLLSELGIQDAKILLSVGEISKRKNHRVVIECLPKLPEDVHYVVLGEGPLKNELEKLAVDLGVSKRLHFLGYKNNVIEYMKSSDIFVFPSLQEGLPVSLMEAMASGIPCIVSDIRGNNDLAQVSSKVVLFKLNIDNLSDVITTILLHDSNEKIVSEKFETIDCMFICCKMKRIYQNFIKEKE